MQFGRGPLGLYYGMPYGYPWYGEYSPYFSPWGYIPKEEEKAMLEDQIKMLEDQLEYFKGMLAELERTDDWSTPRNQGYWRGMQSWQAPYPQYGPGMSFPYPGFQPPPGPMMTKEQELSMLNNQARFLKQQMEQIDARIKELGKEET